MDLKKCYIVLGISLLIMQASVAGAETAVDICHNEDTLVSVWASQQVVRNLDYQRGPPTMEVDWRRWMSLPYKFQANIAVSAFCRVAALKSDSVLEVRDQGGKLLGSVQDGQWHNLLTGE